MGRFDQIEHRLGPEPADDDRRPPDGEDAEHAVDQAPAVEQRGRDQQAVVGRVVDARELAGVVEDVAVGEHHPLGMSGRARGVEQAGQGAAGQVQACEAVRGGGQDRVEGSGPSTAPPAGQQDVANAEPVPDRARARPSVPDRSTAPGRPSRRRCGGPPRVGASR